MEREIEYWAPGAAEPRPVRVRFGLPEPHPEHDWACSITILGFEDEPYSRLMYGTDPVYAMSAALAIAPFLLRTFVARGGRLTWGGRAELGFPSLFSEFQQHYQLHPADGAKPRRLSVCVHPPERTDASWSAVVVHTGQESGQQTETRVSNETWAEALERAAAIVPEVLRAYVTEHGGDVSEAAPSCRID